MNDMKRIVVSLVALLVAVIASAQVVPEYGSGHLVYHRGELYIDNHELNPAEIEAVIGSDLYYDTYVGASRQRRAGKPLIIAGAVTAGTGAIMMGLVGVIASSAGESIFPPYYAGWGFLTGLGVAALAAGIPLRVVGDKRLSELCRDYNKALDERRPAPEIGFGITPSGGAGLTLKF